MCAQALRSRDSSKLHADHKDTPYHKDYLAAESIEDKRNEKAQAWLEAKRAQKAHALANPKISKKQKKKINQQRKKGGYAPLK